MGVQIGSAFYNQTDEGKEYYSVVLDDAIKELHPILKANRFVLKEIPPETRNENSPIFRLEMYKPKEK